MIGSAATRSPGAALVRKGWKRSGLRDAVLARLPGSDPRKVKIARMVWEQNAVSKNGIAERLQMRSAANVCRQRIKAVLDVC